MHPHFEKSTGYLIIEWYEKRENASSIHHYYSFQPNFLQLHPKDPKKVIRAKFEDKMPGWMEKYAKDHDFKCQQVTRSGEVGWWIANWRIYSKGFKPFTSPDINGSFEQLTRLIPDVCGEWKSTILENREVIKLNLLYYPDAYQEFGLYFRSEEIEGIGGTIVFEDFIPERSEEESDDDYRSNIEKDGRLERLIFELVTPLPEPIKEDDDEELVIDIEEEDILDIDLTDEEEIVIEGIEFEDVMDDEEELSLDGFELEDEETIDEESLLSDFEVEEIVEEESVAFESEEIVSDELLDTTELVEKDVAAIEESQSKEEKLSNDESSGEEEIDQPLLNSELKVTDVIDKKVVEGQFSLF